MNTSSQDIFSLYRSYIRQVRALPHEYLRFKGTDDFRSVLKTTSVGLRKKKLKRVSKDLRRLQAANGGKSTAFNRVLDTAYGRVGKLRRELIEPLLSDTNTPLRPLTNTRRVQTCSPAYPPQLVALLTSNISRKTRPLQKNHLISPPGLSGRATLDSEGATPLRPLSSRRECNIRWRFFKSELKKIYPPLQVSPQHPVFQSSTHDFSNHPSRSGFQNTSVLQELLALAGSPSRISDHPTNKQRGLRVQKITDTKLFDGNLPVRWLRRHYQALLGRVPLLVPRPLPLDNSKRAYDIRLTNNAITVSRPHLSRMRIVDEEDALWISDVHSTVQSGIPRR